MFRFLLKSITLVICLQGLAWHPVVHKRAVKPQTGLEMIEAFTPVDQQVLKDSRFFKAKISQLFVSPKILQFQLGNLPIRVQWLGEKHRLIKFNGRVFSSHDLQSEATFRKAFAAKFGITFKHREAALISNTISRSYASETTNLDILFEGDEAGEEGELERDLEQQQAPENSINFEGETDYTKFVMGGSTFPEGSSMANTTMGQRFDRVADVLTGNNMLGYSKFVFTFLGGIAFAMNPADGYKPGLGLINGGIGSPGQIKKPY